MNLPEPPKFKKLLGPSFILLGLGLGSGEIILWPYLTANYGLGIIWGALLGITLQFFINMEIERYALVRGESVFVGFAKKVKYLPIWFIFSTFLGFGWPGIIGASAKLVGAIFNITQTHYLAIVFLVLIGLILTLGPVLYKTVEKFTMSLIIVGVPIIIAITLFIAKGNDWQALLNGIVGMGDDYNFFPKGISFATFLAAFAFSGAGGNLNLAQSFYIKEKGYGMGKYAGKITSILTGKKENLKLEGNDFELTSENVSRFKKWWKLINLEHLIVFWLAGALSICMLALLSFSTAYGLPGVEKGVGFVLTESIIIAQKTFPILGTLFLVITGLMLFQTQLTVMDATSRIMSENLLILKQNSWPTSKLPKIYYSFLWSQIVFGIIVFLFGFTEPLLLITISAVINAFAMFVHIGLTTWLNLTSLRVLLRPALWRVIVMLIAFLFFAFFSFKTLQNIFI